MKGWPSGLVAQWYPLPFFGYGFPYKVTNPKKGCPCCNMVRLRWIFSQDHVDVLDMDVQGAEEHLLSSPLLLEAWQPSGALFPFFESKVSVLK